jgi:hypothetical protein
MITIHKRDGKLILTYETDNPWVVKLLEDNDDIPLRKRTFIFTKDDLVSSETDPDGNKFEFVFGTLIYDYYLIKGKILGINHDVYICKDFDVSEGSFVKPHTPAIFKKINELVDQDIYIGGDNPDRLPVEEFERLLKDIPNTYEVKKYVNARVGVILGSYFESASDVKGKYDRYMNKRQSLVGKDLSKSLKSTEIIKYQSILETLKEMLKNEKVYNEKQWQEEILKILLILYPKYIYTFREAIVKDSYKDKDRKLDFILVDSNGNIDVIEIKKPMEEKIMAKTTYRDNHIPLRELSGSVMQIEKYVFYLNKSGQKGEERLTKQYKDKLPEDFNIKITNPGGIIIMGRENGLSIEQKEDFEVIKRKYKNIVDIITYDDLIRRVESIIKAWQEK